MFMEPVLVSELGFSEEDTDEAAVPTSRRLRQCGRPDHSRWEAPITSTFLGLLTRWPLLGCKRYLATNIGFTN